MDVCKGAILSGRTGINKGWEWLCNVISVDFYTFQVDWFCLQLVASCPVLKTNKTTL